MELVSFIAESANEAIDKVRKELGPDAIIEQVVKLPAKGVDKIWKKPRIQVFARPSKSSPEGFSNTQEKQDLTSVPNNSHNQGGSEWAITELLEASGVLPQYALQVMESIQKKSSSSGGLDSAQQKKLTSICLAESWRPFIPSKKATGTTNIFIGPAGVGKSTVMCKWMTHHHLLKSHPTRAFQLDTERVHNNSDLLSVHCEILGLELEKFLPDSPSPGHSDQSWFVDFPGTDFFHPDSIEHLKNSIAEFENPDVHLVLNLAYESPILLGQLMSCIKAKLPLSSLIITHLDEEMRWGKIWNAVFASHIPISFFSNGQNIPGDFLLASPDLIFGQQFPS